MGRGGKKPAGSKAARKGGKLCTTENIKKQA